MSLPGADNGDEFSVSRSRSGTLPRRLTMGSSSFGQSKPANAPAGLWRGGSNGTLGGSGTLKRPSISGAPAPAPGQLVVPTTPSNSSTSSNSGTLGRSPAFSQHQHTLPTHLSMNFGSTSAANAKTEEQPALSKEAQEEEAKLIAKEKNLTWDDKQRMKDTALKVREEILNTEKSYVEHLKQLCNGFVKSFDRPDVCKTIGIDASQKTALVSNIQLLSNFHVQFLIDLEGGGFDDIENVFIKYSAFFRMYSTYMSNYQKCVDTLQGLRTNKAFQEHMNSVYISLGENGKPGDLMSFMIRPVQRVPRYVLLLRELRRHTLPSSSTFKTINLALSKISDTAMHINNSKRQIENMNTLISLQQRIGGDFGDFTLIQPYRRLIFEGEVIFREARKGFFGTIKESPRILFLFNDILLWTNKNMEFKQYAFIVSIRLESIDDLHFQMQNSSVHIVVKCASRDEKDHWMREIGSQHQEQAKARIQKLAVKRSNSNSIRNTTHNKILDSFQQLHDRNTLSRKEAEAIKMQLAAQNQEAEPSMTSEMSRMSLNESSSSIPEPSSPATEISTPESANPPGYRARVVASRSLRSGRTTAGAALVDKFNVDLAKPSESN